jgi:hypothetical protein
VYQNGIFSPILAWHGPMVCHHEKFFFAIVTLYVSMTYVNYIDRFLSSFGMPIQAWYRACVIKKRRQARQAYKARKKNQKLLRGEQEHDRPDGSEEYRQT